MLELTLSSQQNRRHGPNFPLKLASVHFPTMTSMHWLCFFGVFLLRNRFSDCITQIKEEARLSAESRSGDGVVINSQWEKTLELCKGTAWWFNLSSSDYKLIQLARQETALTPKLPDFPGWKHLFGRHFTQASLPLKCSSLAGLGAKVKRVNYKTFWFSTNSILSLAEEQVLRSWKPRLTAVEL